MRRLVTAFVAVAMSGAAGPGLAAPSLPGVIYATDTSAPGLGPVTVNPNGGSPTPTCAGDPSSTLPRLFVAANDDALVWSDESCLPTDLVRDPGVVVSYARWSPAETHVAFLSAPRTDPPTYERSISVASVSRNDGSLSVAAVTSFHTLPYGGTGFSWMPDGERLVFAYANPAHKRSPTDPDSSGPKDIYSVSIVDGSLQNLTNTSDVSEYDPVTAPDGRRIAFVRQTVTRGAVRSDVFTMAATGGAAVQVTTKSNTNATTRNSQPAWSPDGAHLAFACLPNALGASTHVCRIDALGRTKTVDLTPKTGANFSLTAWRTS